MKKKRRTALGKRLALMLALAALPLLALACQKTPDAPIVLQKDMEQMIETAKGGASAAPVQEPDAATEPAQQPDEPAVDLYARLGAPARYTAELTSHSGLLRVHVDAPLLLPEHELSMVRVEKRAFTLDDMRLFARVLLGENPYYVENPYGQYPAAYCRKQAEALRAAIDDWSGKGRRRYDMQYETVEEAKAGLTEWLARAGSAPESLPLYAPDFTWQHLQRWTEQGEVQTSDTSLTLTAMPDPATISVLEARNWLETSSCATLTYERDRDKRIYSLWGSDNDISAFVAMDADAAYALARQTADALGFADFACTGRQRPLGDNRDWGGYGFVFTRCFSGVPETYTDTAFASDFYKPNWTYEQLSLLIDDEGVLQLWYDAPERVLDTVTETAQLLPFSEIQSVFEKMVLLVNNHTEQNEMMKQIHLELDYHITEVRLGLMTIAEGDEAPTGMTVPVWDFLGYQTYRSDTESGTSHTARSHAFLTVNAVDGTIIDRAKGY